MGIFDSRISLGAKQKTILKKDEYDEYEIINKEKYYNF